MEYLPLILFTISASVTPGPNNTLILSSGINYGLKQSIPHLAGVATGFPLMIIAVGLGAGSVLTRFASLQLAMKIIGAGYLFYLAFRIASAPVRKLETSTAKPFSFMQAVLFQWVNPKAWMIAVGAVTTYTSASGHYFLQIMLIALIFILFGAPCTGLWLLFGTSLKKLLSNPVYLRIFNISMAVLLVASLIPVFHELYIGYIR